MKKIFLCLFCVILLVGCGGKPEGMSDENYELSKTALEVHEDYLSGKITPQEAHDKLDGISDLFTDDGCVKTDLIETECESSAYHLLGSYYGVDNDKIRENKETIEDALN